MKIEKFQSLVTVFVDSGEGEFVVHIDPTTGRIFDTMHSRKVGYCKETWADLEESVSNELHKRTHVPEPPVLPKHVLASVGVATREYREHTDKVTERERSDAL